VSVRAAAGEGAAAAVRLRGAAEPPQHLRVSDAFLGDRRAKALRGEFEGLYSDPRGVSAERCCWDLWFVPNQYNLLRTPAQDFFSEPAFDALEESLLEYGRDKLGCGAISPIWLSMYTHGHRQEFHADVRHGPWAFVLSLTDLERKGFTGGETMLLRPSVLDFWRSHYDPEALEERDRLLEMVSPAFDRLTVFDARLPHGVSVVEGARDPLDARLVLHGWFLDPTPFFEGGALGEEAATEPLNDALAPLFERLAELPPLTGTLVMRLEVDPGTGLVSGAEPLTDTLTGAEDPAEVRGLCFAAIADAVEAMRFPATDAKEPTFITLPLEFA